MGDAGAEAFGRILRGNRQIMRVDLNTNDIGDAGAIALARGLERNEKLRLLGLAWNKVGDAGAAAFAQALRNGALDMETLLLSVNMITEEGALGLLQALPHNRRIEELHLEDCYASKKTLENIERLLRKRHTWKQDL